MKEEVARIAEQGEDTEAINTEQQPEPGADVHEDDDAKSKAFDEIVEKNKLVNIVRQKAEMSKAAAKAAKEVLDEELEGLQYLIRRYGDEMPLFENTDEQDEEGGEVDDDNKEPEAEPEVDNQDEDASTDDDVMNTM